MRHDYYGYDQDYEADEPSGRCEGTRHHKCGRFCGNSFYCARCLAEIETEWRADMLTEAAHENERAAREQAAWDAEEQDSRAANAISAWDAELYEPDSDLPF